MNKLIAVLVLTLVATSAMAQTLTNRAWESETVTGGGAWHRVWNDQSEYPSQNARHGSVIRFFDSTLFTNVPAKDITTPVTLNSIFYGEKLGFTNFVISGGFIQVIRPNAGTNWVLSSEATGNIKAAGNWLATTGIKALTCDAYAGTAIGPMGGTQDVVFTWGTGSTLTNAAFIVCLDVWLGQ